MSQSYERDLVIADLRGRLSKLSEAGLRINESLDLDTVLRLVVDSARSLRPRASPLEKGACRD